MSSKKIQIESSDFKELEKLFEVKINKTENISSLSLINKAKKSQISVDIIKEAGSSLISVYTENAHMQLQNCQYYIVSKMLSEAIFVSESVDLISGLIISKDGDCSLYSNVSKDILKIDYSRLSSEKLISAIALSLTEI